MVHGARTGKLVFSAALSKRLFNLSRTQLALIGDLEAHLAGGAGNDAEGSFVVAGVEVFALGVHDVHDLFARDLADLCLVRFFRAGGDVGRFLQEDGSRRTLRDECERFVFVNRDHYRKNDASMTMSVTVKLL